MKQPTIQFGIVTHPDLCEREIIVEALKQCRLVPLEVLTYSELLRKQTDLEIILMCVDEKGGCTCAETPSEKEELRKKIQKSVSTSF